SLPGAAKPRRGQDERDRRHGGRGGRGRKKHQGRVVAQLGGEDQPPYCTPGGQYCDVDTECCNDLCCGNKCCHGTGPELACCTSAQGKEHCTVLTTSTGHCGKCGNKCPPGMHCDNGKCAGEQADPDDICETDRDCVEGVVCCGQVCCGAPYRCCKGECAFPDGGDHRHCGACGKACAPWEICCFNHGDLGPDWECRRQEECCLKQTLDTGKLHVPCGTGPHGTCCPDDATCCGETRLDAGEICCNGRPTDPADRQHCGSCAAACGPKDVCCALTDGSGQSKHFCASLETCCQERAAAEQTKLFPCGKGPDGTCCRLSAEDCVDGEHRPAGKGRGDDPDDGPKGAAPPRSPSRQRRAARRRR
ncbi:MAG: hypothetical protein M3464_12510, partial [Chloroflexota bacterium]|nr:hypothetical protein [Chloroflexota bacterium]